MKQKILWASIVLLLAGAALVYRSSGTSPTDEHTIVHGDLTVNEGEIRSIPGGTLTVTGDLTVNGTLECTRTPEGTETLLIEVEGKTEINGTLSCLPTNATSLGGTRAIVLITPSIVVAKDAHIWANGTMEIVRERSLLANDPGAIGRWRDELSQKLTRGARLGFVEGSPIRDVVVGSGAAIVTEDPSVIGGTWHMGDEPAQAVTPKEPVKDLSPSPFLHIDMGDGSALSLDGLTFLGGTGRSGAGSDGVSCDALGGDGGDATFFRIHGGAVSISASSLRLGDGGTGGSATTKKDCPNGTAIGGNGGRPGGVSVSAAGSLSVRQLAITPGKGGRGGDAKALGTAGKGACPGEDGTKAIAHSGAGGTSGYLLTLQGNVQGGETVTLGRVIGGDGGNVFAKGGDGGKGTSCGCAGGKGGDAEAVGGDGGVGVAGLPERTVEAHGGDAGKIEVMGGVGGEGGMCDEDKAGGEGGKGGNTTARTGEGGKGTTARGGDGILKIMTGGNGGDGGEGCPPGEGGEGGLGAPLGTIGISGVSLCPKTTTPIQTDPGVPMVKAILYHGMYLPRAQLVVSTLAGCGAPHWRAEKGSVTATNGTVVSDPLFACGYGKVSDTPVVDTPESVLDLTKPD